MSRSSGSSSARSMRRYSAISAPTGPGRMTRRSPGRARRRRRSPGPDRRRRARARSVGGQRVERRRRAQGERCAGRSARPSPRPGATAALRTGGAGQRRRREPVDGRDEVVVEPEVADRHRVGRRGHERDRQSGDAREDDQPRRRRRGPRPPRRPARCPPRAGRSRARCGPRRRWSRPGASVRRANGEVADPHEQRGGRAVQRDRRGQRPAHRPGGDGRAAASRPSSRALVASPAVGSTTTVAPHERRRRRWCAATGSVAASPTRHRAPQPDVVDAQPDAGLVLVASDRAPDLDRVVVVARAAEQQRPAGEPLRVGVAPAAR